MKGKGNKDVHILCGEGYIPPEPSAPMKKNSLRKSILVTGDHATSNLFSRRVRMTQNLGEVNSPSELFIDLKAKKEMPLIKELNEEKHLDEHSKLSKGDLSSSQDSNEELEDPVSLIKKDSDRLITLDQDINLSPRRSQSRGRIQATRIPSFNEFDKRGSGKTSPFSLDMDRKSIHQILQAVPDIEEEEDDHEKDEENFMPDEIESPGLKNMKKRIKEEARLSQLSPKSPFMKRTSNLNIAQVNKLAERETPQIPTESKKAIQLQKIENDSPRLSPANSNKQSKRDLIIPIVTPDISPKKSSEAEENVHKNKHHRASLKYSISDQFSKRVAELGESALNEIRTPQGLKSQSQFQIKEAQLISSKKEQHRRSKDLRLRYSSKDEISINFSRKGSAEDIGSDTDSDKSDKNSAEDPVEDFSEFEKQTDQEAFVLKSPKFIEELKKKISFRYQNMSNLCLGIVCLDMILSEFYFFGDSSIKHQHTSYHIIYFFIILFTLILMIMRINIHHLDLFKTLVLFLIFSRLLMDFIEIYLYLDDISYKLK